ncbi:MAG: sirohydrochlorin cobaltochelatase [Candidatus Methanoplasma sp.]|jgi:sirohydrochlorin ferrochelatase|nr:sirohydrochlorin cobaltochelatase [Candidatus Methanoplasma sp.]
MGMKGILLVGHGSRSGSNEPAVKMHADYLRDRGYKNVYYSFKGYSEPYVQNVIEDMAAAGIDEVIVVPLFIARGHYANDIVPRRVGLGKGETEGTVSIGGRDVHIKITDVFGYHPMLSDIIVKMIEESEDSEMKNGALLIGHGSKGEENKKMIMCNAERVGRAGKRIYIAFNEFNDPTIEDALTAMGRDGIEHISAIPLFVSSGEHTAKDLPEKLCLNEDGRTGTVEAAGRIMSVSYSAPIGMRPEVGSIIESMVMARI